MGKFDGVLLVSDFDGTLCEKDGVIPPENLRAIERFRAEGGRFTVATGRSPVTLGKYADLLGTDTPAVLFNGSMLYDFKADKPLLHVTLGADAPKDLAALCKEMPEVGVEAHHVDRLYVYRPNWVFDYHMGLIGGIRHTVCPVEEMPLPWTKVIVLQEHETLLRARELLLARCAERYEIFFSDPNFLELVPKGSGKGGMVRRLADRLGIAKENLYCVGDSQNDVSMLKISAVPFAPADCTDEVRSIRPHMVRPCDEGAIADVVGYLEKVY